MHDLPTDWSALCAIIFLLGMRHGFDADHLATIDGLTRLSARRQRGFSRYCGVLFSPQYGGVAHAFTLGLLFVLGMLVTDGLNGWWISRLIARADQIAALASRIMSLAVSSVSLLVAGLGVGKLASPWIDHWSEGKELMFGAVVVLVIAASYLLALWLARRALPTDATRAI